ncbi:MAG: molybdopterin molybdotransferase MoeA [Aquificae bacterium]|nr:molybdopterin molybdotransferase MoeA [Aquificota bacterium]
MGLISFEEALEEILSSVVRTTAPELRFLDRAVGQVAAEELKATFNYPLFDYAAMDGFAVRSAETAAASPERPLRLRVIKTVAAGEFVEEELPPGGAYKIFTGAPLPPGADAVVELEKVKVEGDEVLLFEPVPEGANVRFAGEYAKLGQTILERGEDITPGKVAVLAAFGLGKVKVFTPPRVAVLSTGSEVREPCEPLLRPGQIYDANSHSLAAAARREGFEAVNLGNLPDEPKLLEDFLKEHLYGFDAFITTGGVSAGERDFIPELVKRLGIEAKFHKVAIKPGKPTLFGTYDGGRRLFFGLPGNPVSALVNFYLLVYPALRKLQGAKRLFKPKVRALLTEDFRRKNASRREFIRVRLSFGEDGTLFATPYRNTSSGDVLSLGFADGVAVIYEGVKEVERNRPVEVVLF